MPRRPDLPCASCGMLMWRGKGVLPFGQATCRDCRSKGLVGPQPGSPMYTGLAEPKKRTFNSDRCGTPGGSYHHRRYGIPTCEPCRLARNAYQTARRVRLDAACAICAEHVSGTNSERPMHKACREAEQRREARLKAALAKRAKAEAGSSGVGVWVTGECAQCLRFFARKGMASAFCSKPCSKRARPSGRQFKINTRARLAIYERDHWTCRLCMEPVDPDLMTLDPINDWAPSLDHIEPQSHALIPDHSPSNLRLAHRWCNSVRGDLTYYDESILRVA